MWNRHLPPLAGWDIAGTEEHATKGAFTQRVSRDNVRLAGNLRASMNRNSKANRLRYGLESEYASFTLYADMDPEKTAKVLKAAAWLPGFTVKVREATP